MPIRTASKSNAPQLILLEFHDIARYTSPMRRLLFWLPLVWLLTVALPAGAATGRVMKVLPLFMDLNGQHTLSPSLYERDAYQAELRRHPEKRAGLLFEVQWKTKGKAAAPLKVRVELRGTASGALAKEFMLEKIVVPPKWFSHWTGLKLEGQEYLDFGEVTAWRVTLFEGDRVLGEQKSFLW
jgi:hypothetical protein